MRLRLLFFFFCHVFSLAAHAEDSCSPGNIIELLRSKTFTEIRKVAEIPLEVRTRLEMPTNMADAGETWNASCDQEPGERTSSLRFAGVHDSIYVVFYERGGIARRSTLAFFCNGTPIPYSTAPEVTSLMTLGDSLFSECFGNVSKEVEKECYLKTRALEKAAKDKSSKSGSS